MGVPIKYRKDEDLSVWALPVPQQQFVLGVVRGDSLTDAYLAGYPDCNRDSARTGGSRMLARADIRLAIEEIQAQHMYSAVSILRSAQREAARTLVSGAKGEPLHPSVLQAARDVLDRTGVSPKVVAALELRDGREQELDDILASI